jgi:hypothetical protein
VETWSGSTRTSMRGQAGADAARPDPNAARPGANAGRPKTLAYSASSQAQLQVPAATSCLDLGRGYNTTSTLNEAGQYTGVMIYGPSLAGRVMHY